MAIITKRKVSTTEKVALEHIEFQKLALEKSLAAAAEDLAGLGVSRETMIKAIEKFSLNIPILVLAQLNREIEKTGSKMAQPRLSHLRESGTIEQDADVVAFLHRDRDDSKTLDKFDCSGIDADLIIEKNRNGRTGFVKLLFFPYRMEFLEKSRYDENDRPTDV